jgi:histidine triad (HIT) family protein
MEDTIFDKIVRKEIPATVVYEDDATLALLDIHPNHPGHTLIIPKQHSRNILDISEDSWLAVMKTARLLAPAIMRAMGADGVNIVMNNEHAAGQAVFSSHVHVIPRHAGDAFPTFPPGEYDETTPESVAQKIRAQL